MNSKDVLDSASTHVRSLRGHIFDILTIAKPVSPDAAVNLAKVISKLSPLLGNLIEFNTVEFLNRQSEYRGFGVWKRQDPGFPDAIFDGSIVPSPGLEIKTWFPLATEITARFKDSQNHFNEDQTQVCLLAWIPKKLVFGRPYVIDVCVVSGRSVAESRDSHYHNPPDYLVLEPEDTKLRTRNLQQTNTNGYKWQGTHEQFARAQKMVAGWGRGGRIYKPTLEYQVLLRKLMAKYNYYRLDTNFAKIDRIVHQGIEDFKERVLTTKIHGMTIGEWSKLFSRGSDTAIRTSLEERLAIKQEELARLVD